MLKNTNKDQKGFTIIEVLIVLAIAGLILLIVFLAVPALPRNSRNTQIKNSAAAVLAGVSEYQNNNNGQMPTTVSAPAADGTVTISGASGTASSSAKVQPGYDVALGTAVPNQTGSIIVRLNVKCLNNSFGAATPRAIAVGYTIETGGTPAPQCVES